ncbi:MAG TPA: SIR2 family protein, partial [Vicinamibacterales bacterium]|nr:SIR2 family protein [Vicinamibacterales bacterium]
MPNGRPKPANASRSVPPITRQVAVRLAAAHLSSSGLEPQQWHSLSDSPLEKFKDHPVIVAVGAGASKTVFPDARQAVDDLLRNMNVDPTDRDFKAERQRLEEVFGADRDAFETSLQALTATWWGDRRVREVLASMYEKRYVPLLRYEVLAHLFKHRFVNAIINFNFDEELDQSISDELNNDEYIKIVSDGDWRRARELQGQRLYIKPHGTISAPSTLRFTREAYWRTPSAVMAPLTRLIKGQPIIVVTVGFALTSFEFNALLNESAEGSEIYSFDIKRPEPQLRRDLKPVHIAVDKHDPHDLDRQLALLWQGAKAVLPDLPLRGIWRHELIAALFRERVRKPEEPDQQEYFYDRTLIEICLAFAKGKGLLNLSALVEDRTGIYFDKYRKLAGSHAKSLVTLCRSLGLQGFGYGHEIMTHKNNPEKDPPRIIPAVPASGVTFKDTCDDLLRDLRHELSDASQRRLDGERQNMLTTLQRLYESAEVEITGERRLETSALFHSVKRHLDNATALYWRTTLLLRRDWSRLYVVAETGEWLLDKKFQDLIVRDDR